MTIFCTRVRRRKRPTGAGLRSDERGIAMTEAAIALPVFVLLWMGFIYLHQIYLGRLAVQVEAHGAAFSGAMVGRCEGMKEESGNRTGERVRDEIDGQTANSDIGSLSGQAEESLSAGDGGDSLFDWSHYTTEARIAMDGLPAPFGGPRKSAVGRARVLCNMKPAGGLGDAFYDMVKGWFE